MPNYTYVVTQEVHYFDPVEFDSPADVAEWIEGGEWDVKHNEVKSQHVKVIDAEGKVVYDSDSDEGNARPSTSCGCGYSLVWVEGGWQHDAAPSFWGNDHGTDDIPPPALNDNSRIEWDVEDGISELVEARASELDDGKSMVFNEFGAGDWTLATKVDQHGDTMLITTSDGTETTLDIDTVVERVIAT